MTRITALATVLLALGSLTHCAFAQNDALVQRIEEKAARAQEQVQILFREGYDVRDIVAKMRTVGDVAKSEGPLAADALLDEILAELAALSAESATGPTIAERIKTKAASAQQRVQALFAKGHDVRPIVEKMKRVQKTVKTEGPVAAETLLDEILEDIAAVEGGRPSSSDTVAASQGSASFAGGFSAEKPVEMIGYEGHIMELFLSRDDEILFFNNLNDPDVNTNIHYARRLDVDRFEYLGEVRGIGTQALEGVPTLDRHGNFYFISNRSYDETHSTVYGGTYRDGKVSGVHIVEGNVNGKGPPFFNMGVEISPDGRTMYYSEAVARPGGGGPPADSNIRVAKKSGDAFIVPDNVDEIMENINTQDEMEYAASISEDGLELFFNRSKMLIEGNRTTGADLKIMVARRPDKSAPFGEPEVIQTISGFVEGATITSDGRVLYYHKRDNSGRFRIARVERDVSSLER